MIKPLNNHCLIEVIDQYEGVLGSGGGNMQKGVLKDFTPSREHLTASTGHIIEDSHMANIIERFTDLLGKTVYWEEYSDMGKQFDIDGKKYVLIPFYRIIAFEE